MEEASREGPGSIGGRVLCGLDVSGETRGTSCALSEPCQNRFDDVIERDRHERGYEQQGADCGQCEIRCHDAVHLRGRSPGVSITAQGLQQFHLVSPALSSGSRARHPPKRRFRGLLLVLRRNCGPSPALIQPGDG